MSKIRPLPYLSPPLGLSERGGAPWRQEAARDRGAWLAGLSRAAGYNLSEGSASRSMRQEGSAPTRCSPANTTRPVLALCVLESGLGVLVPQLRFDLAGGIASWRPAMLRAHSGTRLASRDEGRASGGAKASQDAPRPLEDERAFRMRFGHRAM